MTKINEAGYSGKSSGLELVFQSTTPKRPRVARKRRLLTPARRAQNRASQARYRLKQRQLSEEESARTESKIDDESSDVAALLDNQPNATATLIPPQELDQPKVTTKFNHLLSPSFRRLEAQNDVWQHVENTSLQAEPFVLPSTGRPNDRTGNSQWDYNDTIVSRELEPNTPNNYISVSEIQDYSSSIPSNSHILTASKCLDQTGVDGNHWAREQQSIIPPTPFLLINHIRLRDMTFLAATLAIAASIGVTSEDYLNDRPSPFYIFSNATSVQTAAHYFEQTVKPHLRPSLTQLSQPHASYLDLIIFPHFRERAVTFATNDPCMLDQEELFNDMISGGLTCWGNADNGVGVRGNGVPWDMRSWEAKPWFTRKWWFLLKEDSEMQDASNWWRQMRGEDIDETLNLGG
ncbi:hypothetical protein T069G_04862 [Trichoderma breve]|uniref:BZIP domain-containing protein n=1 Tax=Trichoderma breve TaxID=2034170 RepID=A0A9W9BCD6_9HYPO|nr:hypothetical protein T069G_04862 [Trichoderma breve]KAJ4859874.1 hypothetical protein T069G_04862 [Trichoderma breve]